MINVLSLPWRWFSLFARPLADENDEERLIEVAQKGGDEGRNAYRRLVERHERWLVNFLTALLSDWAEAEDVAQEVLLKAFFALPRFRREARFRTWLRRIATNEAYNSRRRTREVITRKGELRVTAVERSPSEAVVARQALVLVLDQLAYADREVLVLRHVEELAVAEIASQLDIGLPAAKMRLKRARDRFRVIYDVQTQSAS